MSEHRITSKSRVVKEWYDGKGIQWRLYTCGVTDHKDCQVRISQRTGNKLKGSK